MTHAHSATLRTTAGSVLGAIEQSASAVGSIFSAAGGAATMLNTWVNDAQTKQRDRSVVTMHSYRQRLIEDTAKENSLRRKEITNLFANDEEFKKIYENEYSILSGLFENSKSESSD
jgi:hypothetical protein